MNRNYRVILYCFSSVPLLLSMSCLPIAVFGLPEPLKVIFLAIVFIACYFAGAFLPWFVLAVTGLALRKVKWVDAVITGGLILLAVGIFHYIYNYNVYCFRGCFID